MFSSHIRLSDRAMFAKHLSMMLKSGISLPEALRVLEMETKLPIFQRVLQSVCTDVERGKKLAEALRIHQKDFDPFFVSVVEVSEESGTLSENLEFLAKQLSKEDALHKKIQGILLYPALILVVAAIMGSFISIFILPKLIDLFDSLDVTLPWSTRALLWFAALMKAHGFLIITSCIGFFAMLRFAVHTRLVEAKWHMFLLSLPIIGTFLSAVSLGRLFRGLGIMMRSGLPLVHALGVEEQSLTNRVFQRYARELKEGVSTGTELSVLLERSGFRHVPPLATKMVAVGERTGKLDESFFFLSRFFDEEVDTVAKRFSTLLEPTLLFAIAGIVLFIALSIITPIYSLTGSLQR
ncbi:MAG: type II secretion system F family protein [Candidatus Moraniibacteriota bacterium]